MVQIFPHLGARMKQVVGTLSGGERRMCSIARGLMAEAHIYLVDEPSLGLAPGVAETIVRTLCGLDLGGGALVLAEQNRTLLEGRIDRIVRIHAGKVASIEPGTPSPRSRNDASSSRPPTWRPSTRSWRSAYRSRGRASASSTLRKE